VRGSVGASDDGSKAELAELRARAGLAEDREFDAQMDARAWGPLKDKLTALFKSRTRDDWCAVFDGTDACVSPVLDMDEAPRHPHNAARGIFTERDGAVQPAPAPRYSVTQTATPVMTKGHDPDL